MGKQNIFLSVPDSGLIFGSTSLLWPEYIASVIRNKRYCRGVLFASSQAADQSYTYTENIALATYRFPCPQPHPPVIAEETPFIPARGWAELIRKVYEVDPLLCPSCGGQMSIIAFIEDHKVIDKIISHLKLTFMAERPPPLQAVQQELAAEGFADYF